MALVRGFKSNAERIAAAVRRELDLHDLDALDPLILAEHRGVRVMRVSDLKPRGLSAASARQVLEVDRECFSAATIRDGERALVVYNDAHASTRIANSVSHEMSHLELKHPARVAFDLGCRSWNEREEEEASWLGAALLVTRQAALHFARGGMAIEVAAAQLGVSPALMRMRLNVTGVTAQARRERPRRAS